ncbi:MAG TPA: Ig-like domain-containing protein [Methylomirabilota bacterium]|nr:Ig-like domain-containing protein [Methylomirabilota bacterium]
MRSLVSVFRSGATTLALAASLGATLAGPALAGPYTRLQVLLPGETAAPGTPSGKTGVPRAQTVGVPFTLTVNACDDTWTRVTSITNTVRVLSSDASATLPAPAQLASGTGTFGVTLNASGSFTMFVDDQTDGTIPDGTSASVQALVLQGFVFSTISQKHFTAGTPESMTLRAVDPAGNTVSGFSGVVRLKETTSFGDGRAAPDSITLVNGTWSGGLAALRADETNINRGNCNFYAWLSMAPGKNGTSDPFVVHPAALSRLQLLAPGETALPGGGSGKSGTPAAQSSGQAFAMTVNATDAWWNLVPSADNVRLTSTDAAASTPVTRVLAGGTAQVNVTLNTVGTQTISVTDLTNGGITGMTTPGILVQPNAADHFVVSTIASPQVAGVPVAVTIRATDAAGNTIPNYAGDVNLAANTGAGTMSPERVTLAAGVWAGTLTFKGAGNSARFTCSDFFSPPRVGTSNTFVVSPGPVAGLQILLPGETATSGQADGRSGTPTTQSAGIAFNLTLRAVDAFWNVVPGIADRVAIASSDTFAAMPAETTLANGLVLVPVRLHKSGPQRIWITDLDQSIAADTSSAVTIVGGTFSRVLVLAPGERVAPGTATGRTGAATDQSINYAFTVTVLATDAWWNPITGVNDVVHLTSSPTDPLNTLPPDTPMSDGRADLPVRLAHGGFNQLAVSDVSNGSITGSSTQVSAISSGFHLVASVVPATVRAGDYFTLTVSVTNDAGSVISEINSLVTLTVRSASGPTPGQGLLTPAQIQLSQGTRTVSATYTFAEPIVIVATDDAGNAPAVTNAIDITPGPPTVVTFVNPPRWVGGNKTARLDAKVTDDFGNGVSGQPVSFTLLSGTGVLTALDNTTDATGFARADFQSPRQPELDQIRASSNALHTELELETALVSPDAAGGTITSYPNPFHPPVQGTTLAWKLSDDAAVTLRIYTQSGDLVLQRTFSRGTPGGTVGLNTWVWDGANGGGRTVSSGGYLALIEAQGNGATLHVMRRKIAVVR